MIVKEYGSANSKVIMLLHGGGLSWWSYRDLTQYLQQEYHIIIPILDGHSGSDKAFTTIEDNALEIIQYIDEHFNGSVTLIGGLSLGGQILVEMLSLRQDICKVAFIESALVFPMKMTNRLIKMSIDLSYGLIKQTWFAKLQFQSLKIKKSLFEEYYQDTCNITKENMIAFLKANSSYRVKERFAHTQAKVFVFVGGKEQPIMIRSAKKLHELIPTSCLEIKDQLYHGQFSISQAQEYAEKVKSVLKGL